MYKNSYSNKHHQDIIKRFKTKIDNIIIIKKNIRNLLESKTLKSHPPEMVRLKNIFRRYEAPPPGMLRKNFVFQKRILKFTSYTQTTCGRLF